MQLLRNPEFRRLSVVSLGLCAALAGAGFWISPAAGAVLSAIGVALSCALLAERARWLREIGEVSQYVTRALDGDAGIEFPENREGELSILKNELYKLAAALRQQKDDALEERRRLADSMANISHQLKTPLTSMELLCGFLTADGAEPAAKRRYALELGTLTRRMEALVCALLRLSQLDAGTIVFRRDPCRVDDVIDLALRPLAVPLEVREISVLCEGAPEDGFLGDAGWTAEAIGNILKNCMEHAPSGSRIVISHEETPIYTSLTVCDCGPGVDEEDLPHIFERFYRGKNAAPDSIGIGLALSREILFAQNATVTVQNRREGGCAFRICFHKRVV